MGDFNTQGMTKCDCGQYYPEGWGSHGRGCPQSAQQEEDDDDAREHGYL